MFRGQNLTLTTQRLLLRPISLEDAESIWSDASQPAISRYMAWAAHANKDETMDFVKGEVARIRAEKGITWSILKEGKFCGIVSLIALLYTHRALTYDKAELAYWLGLRHQGQGIMTEAVRSVVQFGFQELKLHKICVSHFSRNVDSERLIRRLGFRCIGEQIEEFQKDGVWHNHKNYELLAREFLERRQAEPESFVARRSKP